MTSEFRVPAPLQNTIDNLTFLASTDDGEKLFFKERLHINKTDWTARMRRYYYNETLESQKKIIKEIIDLGLDSLKSYRNNVHYRRLVTEFSKAKDGLCNLRNTYLKEGREVQDLDNYIYVMENQINALSQNQNQNRSENRTNCVMITNENNEAIVNKWPMRSASTLNTSQHYHFGSNEDTSENASENTSERVNQNTSKNQNMNEEKNHYIIDMSTLNTESPVMNKSRTKTRPKTIPIKNRPELEEYMNRNKQQ